MAGAIRIKKTSRFNVYQVTKHNIPVATIRLSEEGEFGHITEVPWLLVSEAGRIDRHSTYQDAVDDAHKI